MAGVDSTATAMRCTFFYIISSPRIYPTLQREIDTAIANGATSRPIKNSAAKTLP
jgi:hypothetical protein